MESTITLKDGMAFDVELDGHRFTIDADPKVGGRDLGPKPKGLTLSSLGGCTAMDVISILRKMRVDLSGFSVRVEGTLAEDHPRKFDAIVVHYLFEGQDLPIEKLRKAVNLSEERYCGVSANLRPAVDIQNRIWLNGSLAE